jgi:hypothetical protein
VKRVRVKEFGRSKYKKWVLGVFADIQSGVLYFLVNSSLAMVQRKAHRLL